MFVGTTNVANSIAENSEFRELLQELNPYQGHLFYCKGYTVPSVVCLGEK